MRLTGPVAIADEEYATLQEGAFVNTTLTIVVVLTILWLALRSFGIILAVFVSLLVGLSITAAIGLALVGALNLISVAFAVLFIGLGVDFGIQFSVRYRAERHEVDDLHQALMRTARYVGAPLTLAAAATAAGFLSFLPTDYKGLSELGLLAGLGMIIAFITSITVIPALLMLLQPAGRTGRNGLHVPRAPRSGDGAAPDSDHRLHRARGRGRTATAVLAAVRLQSAQPAEVRRSSWLRRSWSCAAIPRSGRARSICWRRTRRR